MSWFTKTPKDQAKIQKAEGEVLKSDAVTFVTMYFATVVSAD